MHSQPQHHASFADDPSGFGGSSSHTAA
jgi:hypothetical protein